VALDSLPDVVMHTPAMTARRAGPFVSVMTPVSVTTDEALGQLEALESALSVAFPLHEIMVVVMEGRTCHAWAGELTSRVANVQVIGLLPGASEEQAFTAGLDTVLGDIVVTAHLGSDDPSDIIRCAELVRTHDSVVYGIDQTSHGRAARGILQRTATSVMCTDVPSMNLGLRGFTRPALDTWLPRRDRDKVLRLLPLLAGYPYTVMPYEARRPARDALGFRQTLRSLFYASARPLRAAVGLALVGSALNAIYALYVLIIAIVRGAVEGWTSMSLQISMMFFLLSIVIAIMAEFMYHAHETGSEQPLYRITFESTSSVLGVRDRLNVEAAADAVHEHDARDLES
jgi:hypothetical protein